MTLRYFSVWYLRATEIVTCDVFTGAGNKLNC